MNGGNCQNCANSRWVQMANQFITSSSTNPHHTARVATVEFLLQNGYCGINNRTGINDITRHLATQGFFYNRSAFQNNVLTELKRLGIVVTLVYPGGRGGVFIPSRRAEIIEVARQLVGRVVQELTNIEEATRNTPVHRHITQLRRAAEQTRQRI
jgi:hypothetical protein